MKNCRKYRLGRLRVEFLENGFRNEHEILRTYRGKRPHKHARYDVTSCFWSAFLSKFEKPKMHHPTALFALSMQCQWSLQISRVKNIGNVLELSGVAFRLAPPHGGLVLLHSGANDLWLPKRLKTASHSSFRKAKHVSYSINFIND